MDPSPTAEAQRLVIATLLALAKEDIEVIAIAGNHDSGSTFEAFRPLMGVAGINLYGQARAKDKGGVYSFTARSTGEPVNVAVIPFLSQRYAVRAAQLVAATPAENSGSYDQMVRDVLTSLAAGFTDDAVNVVMAHLTVTGGQLGGGEREAQSIFEYYVPATAFPATAITSRSGTCTAGRRCRLPPTSPTPARRWPSTSASRTTPRSCAWSRPPRPPRPGSPTSRSQPPAGCAPSPAPSPS